MATKIMVVDDDPSMLKLAETTLKMRGFEVVTAGNGRQAVEIARTQKPDLIVMDLNMPEMDGKTAIAALHGAPETRDIPILVISGLPLEEVSEKSSGSIGFLEKPFELANLARQIRVALTPQAAARRREASGQP